MYLEMENTGTVMNIKLHPGGKNKSISITQSVG